MSMIANFIAGLSAYYKVENDLSNITCILCDVDEDFKFKFLKFFFPDIELSKIVSIEREVPDCSNMGCRVDLHITMEKDPIPYIIEVKIKDRNHHFGQYDTGYKVSRSRFGYITNYNCLEGKQLGYDVKTWDELYKYLSDFTDNDELISGYLEYVKTICNILIYKDPMDITGLSAIPCFIDSATRVIEDERDWIKTTTSRMYIDRGGVNKSFFFKFNGQKERRDGYGLIGLWFQEDPCITICINSRDWLSNRIMDREDTIMDGALYCDTPYWDHYWSRDDVFIDMKEDMIKKFVHSNSYEEQLALLNAFFEEAMERISTCFSF